MARPKKKNSTTRSVPSASKAANGRTMAFFIRFHDVADRKTLEDLAHEQNTKLAECVIRLIREAGVRRKAKVDGWRLAWVHQDGTVAP